MNIDAMVRRAIAGLAPPEYPQAPADALRLDANTNMFGPNPAVERALRRLPDVAQYPSPFSDDLLDALAAEHGLARDRIIAGNGSDEIFDFIFKAFLNPGDRVAVPVPTFVMHPFYGRINFGEVIETPLGPDFSLDVDALLAAKAKIVVVASPNNPTGNRFGDAMIERLIRESGALVVVDEAYAHYCGQDFVTRTAEFESLIVVRTFSKAYALAACRIGYAVSSPAVVRRLNTVKPPFNVGALHERIAVEALRDPEFVRRSVEGALAARATLKAAAESLGLVPRPTDANFMLIDVGRPSADVARRLVARKILVRDMTGFRGLDTHIRVTLGTPDQMDALAAALREALS